MFGTSIQKAIPELFETACPSIQYRVNAEILGRPASSPDMRRLQHEILDDPLVQEIFQWQQPDGWLAWDFHGERSTETGIRVLCEKGIRSHHPVLSKALRALQAHTERLDRGIGKVGRMVDERGFSYTEMIRATVMAYAGLESQPCIQRQLQIALADMQAVPAIRSVDDLAEPYKGTLVFKPGLHWPGIYHLRLLAFTHSWRTPQNCQVVIDAVQRLVDLSPLPSIYLLHKSQLMAPASYAMLDFNPDLRSMDPVQWTLWFHRMECLARLGVIAHIPQLRFQVHTLAELLTEGEGHFPLKLSHRYFMKWGPYAGLALENDWRSDQRRVNDLTFRSLLVLHFAALN